MAIPERVLTMDIKKGLCFVFVVAPVVFDYCKVLKFGETADGLCEKINRPAKEPAEWLFREFRVELNE